MNGRESGRFDRSDVRGMVRLSAASRAPAKTEAGANRERQAGIADGRDVLIIQQVLGLSVDVHPAQYLETATQIQLGVAVIQIAVGQKKAVAAECILALKKS